MKPYLRFALWFLLIWAVSVLVVYLVDGPLHPSWQAATVVLLAGILASHLADHV